MAEFHETIGGQKFYGTVAQSLKRIADAEEAKVDSIHELNYNIKDMNKKLEDIKETLEELKTQISYLR